MVNFSLDTAASPGECVLRGDQVPSPPPGAKWTEQVLEAALYLMPEVLGVSGFRVLNWGGGRTELCPDQLYLDGFGRAHVVELKNERADLMALAQVLSYADHYRYPPHSEIARRAQDRRDATKRAESRLRAFVQGEVSEEKLLGNVSSLPAPAPIRRGLPPRSVLVAPAFAEEVRTVANTMRSRGSSIELLQVELGIEGSRVLLAVEPLHSEAPIEQVWKACSLLWGSGRVRDECEITGFAFHRWNHGFALELRRDPRVCLALEWDDGATWVAAFVPDKYCSDSRRRVLRRRLESRLQGAENHQGWLYFRVPEDAGEAAALGDRLVLALVTWLEEDVNG